MHRTYKYKRWARARSAMTLGRVWLAVDPYGLILAAMLTAAGRRVLHGPGRCCSSLNSLVPARQTSSAVLIVFSSASGSIASILSLSPSLAPAGASWLLT